MNLSRRGFLAAFAATAVADPEFLLWRPGAKLISIPKPQPVVFPGDQIKFILETTAGAQTEYWRKLFERAEVMYGGGRGSGLTLPLAIRPRWEAVTALKSQAL